MAAAESLTPGALAECGRCKHYYANHRLTEDGPRCAVNGCGCRAFADAFDARAAREEGQTGMAIAEQGQAAVEWRGRARAALSDLARAGRPFTADDLVAAVGLPSEGINANNAVGALINGAGRTGLIVKTGRYVKSSRVAGHARTVAEWRGSGGGQA